MRILIYGAGAVGQAVGCMMVADGHSVDLLLRERFIDTLRRDGLSVTGIFGDYHIDGCDIGLYSSIDNISDQTYDYAIIATKSFDTESAISDLLKLGNQSFVSVSLQNGCGNLELLDERFGSDRSIGGRVITGFAITRPGTVAITVTADDIHLGGSLKNVIPQSAKVLANALNNSGLPCTTTPFIKRDLFAKLLYNCALNPLGTILGVHYGALGEDPHSRSVMNMVIDEVFQIIKAMEEETHWNSAEEYRTTFYDNELPSTFHHRSSMLQDIESGKKTEIDALTGYVSAQGRRLNITTPVCDTLSLIVRYLEKNKG